MSDKGLIGELEVLVKVSGKKEFSKLFADGYLCGVADSITKTKGTIDDILGELEDEIDILKGLLDKTDYFEKQNIKLIVVVLEKARQIITSKMGGGGE